MRGRRISNMLGEFMLQHDGKAGDVRVLNAQLNKKEITVIADGKVKVWL
jgi:hypothetical protein